MLVLLKIFSYSSMNYMTDFTENIKGRNEHLFYFGLSCFALSVLFLILTRMTTGQIAGVNVWYKPFKFAVSIALYSFTMAWYVWYLPSFNTKLFNWSVIVLL